MSEREPGRELARIPNPEENKPTFESSINRQRLRIFHTLGGKAIEFTLENTRLYSHVEGFKEFDHVHRKNDEGPGSVYYFRQDYEQLYNDLDNSGYINIRQPYPTQGDERMYYEFQNEKLEKELNKFSNGGDLPS